MKVGLIHNTHRFVHEGHCHDHLQLVSFTISPEHLSYTEIFDSAFASPARYVMEVFRRLHQLDSHSDGIFVFNPLIEFPQDMIGRVLAKLNKLVLQQEPFVFSDENNMPIGYYFPQWIALPEEHFLTVLSTVNARLDQELLNVIYNSNCICSLIEISVSEYVGNGFPYNKELWYIYEWLSRSAHILICRVTGIKEARTCFHSSHEISITQKNYLRNQIRSHAVMPHHAGDVLFYSIAAKYTPDSYIQGIVVNNRYVNILNEILPEYSDVTIDLIPPYRDGTGTLQSDEDYFFEFAADLLPFSFFQFFRPSRDYNATNLHLIDHFAFALGHSFTSSSDLVTSIKGSPDVYKLDTGVPFRILLHFDAGWGLKVYPTGYQFELIKCLLDAGMEVTVLGTEDHDFGQYRSVKFKGLEPLKSLLQSHHILVGSDSFPSHYAAHVMGLPTICLFGPTKPVNSDALPSDFYKALECELTCKPCGMLEDCRMFGGKDCKNMVLPSRIRDEIELMLNLIYQ